MAKYAYDLRRANHVTAAAVGQPGQRVFYLQAQKHGDLVSMIAEKEYIRALCLRIDDILDELAKRTPGGKLGAVGFCFGGGMTWRLIASKDPRLAAAAPFYGPLPEGADFTGSKAAVMGAYAERDDRVNASRDTAKAALEKAKLTHEIVTFPGVDHAFFNDTGPRYNAAVAAQAWTKLLDWYSKNVG